MKNTILLLLLLLVSCAGPKVKQWDSSTEKWVKIKWKEYEASNANRTLSTNSFYYWDPVECTLRDWNDSTIVVGFYYEKDSIK